jgi:hypothetical protein
MDMKRIYGFLIENIDDWGDVFSSEKNSPEFLISSACHTYFDLEGNTYIGFDMSLGMSQEEMDNLLLKHSSRLSIFRVLL